MSDELNVPVGWTLVTDDTPASGPRVPVDAFDGLPPTDRVEAIVRHHVGLAIGEAWLFPPIVVDGAVTYLFGRHDIDVDGDRGVVLSNPLGVATVAGDTVAIEWRWAPAPADATEESAPKAVHRPASDVLRERPGFEQAALVDELYDRATEVALAVAGGGVPDADQVRRTATLFAAVTPAWLRPFYAEVGAPHLASLGWNGTSAPATAPPIDAGYVPAVIADPLGPPEAVVLTSESGLVATVADLGLTVGTGSPLTGMATGAGQPHEGLAECATALRALADPGWVVTIEGLTGAGTIDVAVAIADVDGEMLWTAVSRADGSVVVMPDADANRIAAFVESALDASAIGPQGPVVMPLDAAHMLLFAAVTDEYTVVGDDAFSASAQTLQRRVDEPSTLGTVRALTDLARLEPIRLADGFGLDGYLTIDHGSVSARPMMHRWAAWLARPRARLTIRLVELHPHGGARAAVTGYSFVRTDSGLFVFAVTDPWGLDGIDADRRVDVAAIGTDVLRQMIDGLLGR